MTSHISIFHSNFFVDGKAAQSAYFLRSGGQGRSPRSAVSCECRK